MSYSIGNKLKELIDNTEPVTIFLTSGVRLMGYVTAFDEESLWLDRDQRGNGGQVIFRHAISTIQLGIAPPSESRR